LSTYNYAELEGLWIVAGGNKTAAPIAAAIALAESGGDPTIPNGPYVMGLWQINTAPNANPEYTVTQMKDPLANAVAAVKISNDGTNWNPWQTYTSGAYLKFLRSGVKPVTNFATMTFTPAQQQTIHDNALKGQLPPTSWFDSLGATTYAERVQVINNPNYVSATMATWVQTVTNPTSPLITSGANAVANAVPGLALFSWLTDPSHLLRIGEVILGGLILLIALDETVKAAGATPPTALRKG